MGFFSRRPRDGVVDPVRTNVNEMGPLPPAKEGHHFFKSQGSTSRRNHDVYDNRDNHDHSHHNSRTRRETRYDRKRERRHPVVLSMSRRPPFGQWLKVTLLDILSMAAMGAIGLGVYTAHPAPSRSFPIFYNNGEIVYPEFAYPLRKEIIPIWAAAMLAVFVPVTIFLVCQIRIRSFWDVNNAVLGLLYSLINAAVFQVFIKWLIGGLRPHFLAVCKPDVSQLGVNTGNGFNMIMYDRTVCTGDQSEIDDSLESFPSGHSTAAFAGFVFLYLYLNAKLKVWSNYHPAFWKLIATYAPILGATLIAGVLTIDEYHNWYDCVAGAIIGTVMAVSAYRMVYASVWDFRFNHIPLNRAAPFTYGMGAVELSNAVFTRKAGWGYEEGGMGGAPFDASGFGGSGGGAGAASNGLGSKFRNVLGHHDNEVSGDNTYSNDAVYAAEQGHNHHNGLGHSNTDGRLDGEGMGHDGTAHNSNNPLSGNATAGNNYTQEPAATHHSNGLFGSHNTHGRNVSTGRNSIGRKQVGSGGVRTVSRDGAV